MAARAQTHKVYGFKSMLVMPMVPYALMSLGTVGALITAWGLRVWVRDRPILMGAMSAVLMMSAVGLAWLGWRLFKPHTRTNSVSFLLAHHVVATIALAHLSMYLFMLWGSREFTWAAWLIGSKFLVVTWLIRRFARDSAEIHKVDEGASLGLPGSSFLEEN